MSRASATSAAVPVGGARSARRTRTRRADPPAARLNSSPDDDRPRARNSSWVRAYEAWSQREIGPEIGFPDRISQSGNPGSNPGSGASIYEPNDDDRDTCPLAPRALALQRE